MSVGSTFTETSLPQPLIDRFPQLRETKAVDENGHPKILFRGTSSPERFKRNKTAEGDVEFLYGPGTYFTEDPVAASQYASKTETVEGAVYPAYIVVKNPIDIDIPLPAEKAELIADVIEKNFETHNVFGGTIRDFLTKKAPHLSASGIWDAMKAISNGIKGKEVDGLTNAEISQILQQAGFDGLTYAGWSLRGDFPHQCWVVFDEKQIIPKFAQPAQ
ncbi:hypothetical protein HY310_01165 [Candidatus Microgenomates bacterium]|nr:hypothetical protein [Candidatus Microgenomates bacterium]